MIVCFSIVFCLCFCSIIWFFAPENVSDKFSSCQVFFSGNRTVTLYLVGFPPSRRGKCCPFFYFCVFCVWSGVFCRFFTVLLFLGSLFEKIFGSELLFLGVGVGRVFFGAVLPMFLLYCLVFRSRKCLEKILLMSGLVFGFFFLSSFGFFSSTSCFFCFFLREKAQVVTGHTPTRTWVAFSCSCFCPAALVCSPFLAVRPASWRFLGVPFWAPRVFWDSPGTSEALFLDARRQGCFLVVSFFCFVFPFCCVLRLFSHQLEGADPSSYVAHPRVVVPAPRPSEGAGAPSSATGWPRS